MEVSSKLRQQLWQYLRLIIASGLIGVAFGYYLQVIGRLEMTPALLFEFIVRACLIGSIFWAFEIFYLYGNRAAWLLKLRRSTRLILRVIIYYILFEVGFYLGELLFRPENFSSLLRSNSWA